MMEEKEYKFTAKVLDETKGKVSPSGRAPEEVNCLLTKNDLVIDTEQPIRIPVARIHNSKFISHELVGVADVSLGKQPTRGPEYGAEVKPLGTLKLTYFDDLNHKHRLSLKMAADDARLINATLRRGTLKAQIVVGFWLRGVSDGLDAIFLGLFGFLLAIPFREAFYKLGENGLWIGLCIVFLYTGILQSSIGQGQSLAKKILKIQVLRINGEYMSLPLSFLRYTVIALLFYNSWIAMTLPFLYTHPNLTSVYSIFIASLGLGCVILVALHPLKRGIHDFIAGTIVVRKHMYDREKINELNDKSKAKRAFVVLTVCFLISFFVIGFFSQLVGYSTKDLMAVREQIVQHTDFKNVTVSYHWISTREKSTGIIAGAAFLEKSKYENQEYLNNEIQTAINSIVNFSEIKEYDHIVFSVRTGFNIGIWSSYYLTGHKFTAKGEPLIIKK